MALWADSFIRASDQQVRQPLRVGPVHLSHGDLRGRLEQRRLALARVARAQQRRLRSGRELNDGYYALLAARRSWPLRIFLVNKFFKTCQMIN